MGAVPKVNVGGAAFADVSFGFVSAGAPKEIPGVVSLLLVSDEAGAPKVVGVFKELPFVELSDTEGAVVLVSFDLLSAGGAPKVKPPLPGVLDFGDWLLVTFGAPKLKAGFLLLSEALGTAKAVPLSVFGKFFWVEVGAPN